MALIIDGSTYPGNWKFTADSAAPNEFYVIPKGLPYFTSLGAASGEITYLGSAFTTDTSTIDEFGNALDTSVKVARYLSDNR